VGGDIIGHWEKEFTEIQLFESPELTPLYKYILCGGIQNWVYIRKMDTRDELLARLVDAAARIKRRDGTLRRKIIHFHTRIAKCIEVEFAIFEL
jgi:hypothetical protein